MPRWLRAAVTLLFVFSSFLGALQPTLAARTPTPPLSPAPTVPDPAAAAPQAGPGNWCVAGSFQGWDNASTTLFDNGTNGDLIEGDGVYSRDVLVATAGRHEFKALECGNWGNAFPSQNSWLYTSADNQTVKITFDRNDHSGDAGMPKQPTTNIVNAWDSLPASFTAVGDWQGWNNALPETLMTPIGHDTWRLAYTIPTAGSYNAKIVQTGSWSDQVVADGRAIEGPPIVFTTTSDNQEVIFLLHGRSGRVTIAPNGTGSGNWCVAGAFQSWDNASTPLFDDGTNGDLLGGDGVWSRDVSIATAGRYEFKALECGNWGNAFPGQNAWLLTSADGQTVKITFDRNDHSGDAGPALLPMQNIVNAWDSAGPSFTAVGDWQGWDNSNAATMLSALPAGWQVGMFPIATPGNYQSKIVRSGSWGEQFVADGRAIDGAPVPFSLFTANDAATFLLDEFEGRWNVFTPAAGGAGHDNNIFWDELGHNSREPLYRTPQGSVPTGTPVTLRFRAASGDLTAARVRVWNDVPNSQLVLPMTLVADDGSFEWWEATLPASDIPTIYWYRFVAIDGSATAYYEDDAARTGGWGQPYAQSPDRGWQLTVYDPTFQSPDWVKDAVMYQIFVDRFRDGDPSNNTPAGSFFYDEEGGTVYRSLTNEWNTTVCDPRAVGVCANTYSKNFYGGDLQGVVDRLDYLRDLGVTAIYFNPIFESPSNHKYDTTDFGIIDDNFGDLALFQTLVSEAEARGMHVVLDGVFNHSSSDSIYFDRYGRYAEVGACESADSPYRDWYYFTEVTPGSGPCVGADGTPGAANYESWFGYDSLPKIRATDEEVQDYFWAQGTDSIAPYWMQWGDGWRLDVGGDVDPGEANDANNEYWEGFRDATRAVNPETYIVGEEWNFATAWTLGQEWDATMNYQFSSAVLSFWRSEPFADNDHNSGSSAGILTPLAPSQLDERLQNIEERYPPEAFYAMMNLLGSHDTNRALFMLDHNTDLNDPAIYEDPNYDWSDAMTRLKGVVLLQMTLPGAPTIYYGDEVGLVGPVAWDGSQWQDDPYNRQPYPWLNESGTPFYSHLQSLTEQNALRQYYRTLTGARNSHPALRTGSFDTLQVDDATGIYAYGRRMADYSDAAVVVANNSAVPRAVTLDVDGYLPYGTALRDVLNGTLYTVSGAGELIVNTPAMGGAVLVLEGALAAPPAAVTDLAVTDERPGEVDLAWSAVAGATSYDVYRSLVSGGGYEWVGNTAATSYSDAGLANAVRYFYVVVARNDSTGLVSGYSNEVSAMPQWELSGAWYNLQWPPVITHTISAITPTAPIYGQLYIAGGTEADGPADGILAQVGYGPAADAPATDSWSWWPMTFNGQSGNNDEYVGTLLPDMVGDFLYTTRYSADGGVTWFYTDLDGPPYSADQAGKLHVIPSGDSSAPDAPTVLTLIGTSASSITIGWTASAAADLAGYEIYRRHSGVETEFSLLATVAPGSTTFSDETVTSDETYEYYVVAYDNSFNRSAPSNSLQATAEVRMVTVTWRVTIPAWTDWGDPDYTIYAAGDNADAFGQTWNPGWQPLTEVSPHVWELQASLADGTPIQYKFTRGEWDKVEWWSELTGFANREMTVDYGTDGSQVVEVTVLNWRDLLLVDYSPKPVALNSATAITEIVATFNHMVQADTVDFATQFSVVDGNGQAVAGSWALAEVPSPITGDSNSPTVAQFTFTPETPLDENGSYAVTILPGMIGVANDSTGLREPLSFTVGNGAPTAITVGGLSSGQGGGLAIPLALLGGTLALGLAGAWQRRRQR